MEFNNDSKFDEQTNKNGSSFHSTFQQMTSSMSFVGTFLIVYGAINCLTIIGMIVGIPLIFAGLHLRSSSEHFNFFKSANNSAALKTGFEFQGKFFRIIKILIIISIVLMMLSILLVVLMFSYFASQFSLPQS